MAMKTNVKRNGDTVIVSMDGKLEFENQDPLKENLKTLINRVKTDSVAAKIIFNLEKLEFVGSSGISSFVQTLNEINKESTIRPRYCGVKSEFKRIMKAFDESDCFEFHENEDRAKRSFEN